MRNAPLLLAQFMEVTPDVIHASSPGLLVFGAVFWARVFKIPLVISYHTHIPQYIPQYTWKGLVKPMWDIIRWCSHRANMTLVTSDVMAHELRGQGCSKLSVWERGVDTKVFHPHYRAESMRLRMTDGRDGPIVGYVGRLGAEKNLDKLKLWLEQLPNVNLCLIGDGPSRKDLESTFAGTRTTFMGMLQGEELSSVRSFSTHSSMFTAWKGERVNM
jgi:sulfoquinovosyltransferase